MGGDRLSLIFRVGFTFVLVVSLILNLVLLNTSSPKASSGEQSSKYPLLAKRIFLEDTNDTLINFAPLRSGLELYLSRLQVSHSLYFEYLFTGTSIRLGSDSELVAASLMKIPLVMDLYKAAELGRVDLNQQVEVKQNQLDRGYGELWKRGAGTKLTLREAAAMTLTYSDNTAAHVIQDNMVGTLAEEEASIAQLDVPFDLSEDEHIVINARAYASFLKCLYLSCYLSKGDSQAILSALVNAPRERISKTIPASIPVAHKIGTFSEGTQSDCGIIYAAQRHYLLCVMLQLPQQEADAHFERISQIIYQYVTDEER